MGCISGELETEVAGVCNVVCISGELETEVHVMWCVFLVS